MKLIFCTECKDLLCIRKEKTFCHCKASWGKYLDNLQAEFGGEAVPLGIDNSSLVRALRNKDKASAEKGINFTAFVISSTLCETFCHKPDRS